MGDAMISAHYVVSLDQAYLSSARKLLFDLLWRAPISVEVECLLCSEFDPTGGFVRLVALQSGSQPSNDRPSTTLFLPHHAIALVLQMDDQRIPPGFVGSGKNL